MKGMMGKNQPVCTAWTQGTHLQPETVSGQLR